MNLYGALACLFATVLSWEITWVAALGVAVHGIVPKENVPAFLSFFASVMTMGAVSTLLFIDPLWAWGYVFSACFVAVGFEVLSRH